MTRLIRLTAVFALLASLGLVAGCLQGVGQRCQVQSDCEDGLLCILPAGASPQAGGTCQSTNTAIADLSVATTVDMTGVSTDLAGQPPVDMTQAPND
jgi:hypothetical protein